MEEGLSERQRGSEKTWSWTSWRQWAREINLRWCHQRDEVCDVTRGAFTDTQNCSVLFKAALDETSASLHQFNIQHVLLILNWWNIQSFLLQLHVNKDPDFSLLRDVLPSNTWYTTARQIHNNPQRITNQRKWQRNSLTAWKRELLLPEPPLQLPDQEHLREEEGHRRREADLLESHQILFWSGEVYWRGTLIKWLHLHSCSSTWLQQWSGADALWKTQPRNILYWSKPTGAKRKCTGERNTFNIICPIIKTRDAESSENIMKEFNNQTQLQDRELHSAEQLYFSFFLKENKVTSRWKWPGAETEITVSPTLNFFVHIKLRKTW